MLFGGKECIWRSSCHIFAMPDPLALNNKIYEFIAEVHGPEHERFSIWCHWEQLYIMVSSQLVEYIMSTLRV